MMMKCSNENKIPNIQFNYIFQDKFEFKGAHYGTLFYYSQQMGGIYCIQLRIINGQMKLFQRFRFEKGKITFIHSRNQIIFQTWHSIQLWEVQNSQKWSWVQTIMRFEEYTAGSDYYWKENNRKLEYIQNVLNKNDDLLVTANHSIGIQFWERVKDNWKCQQTIVSEMVKGFQFNSSNSILLAQTRKFYTSKFLIFSKDLHIGQWIIIHEIDDIDYKPFRSCFYDDQTIVCLDRSNFSINFFQISQITQQVIKTQELKIQPEQSAFEGLKYSQSQNQVIAFCTNICYSLNKQNGEYYFQPIIKQDDLYCETIDYNGKIWLLSSYNRFDFRHLKISINNLYQI